ncbi:hypothetical protein Q4595_22570, partial [Wenyingzhuangia sp. 1_MG-2023]|nr:hypothetical protein [Wenyingzhuangia sp. 1_MG-2023]
VDTQPLMDYAHALAAGLTVPDLAEVLGSGPAAATAEASVTEQADTEQTATAVTAADSDVDDSHETDDDSALLEVFVQEANGHLETVNDFVETSRRSYFDNPLGDQVQRALHTLK